MRQERSLILDVGVRAVFHTVLLLSLFLLLSGHNAPGGGFVGGLVAGCAFVLRDVAGGFESRRNTIFEPETLIGVGLLVAAADGFAGLLFGDAFFESAKATLDLPGIGTVKATTALVFDIGVYLVVLGVILTISHQLGEEPER